jgi:hypothetical protein
MRWHRKAPARDSADTPEGREALASALDEVRPRIASLTLYMCWHGGYGHDYPRDVMQAAGRLRARHADGVPDEDYTSLTFEPSDEDLRDFILVASYCDLAYATDEAGEVLAEVSGDEA